ncbi:TonB-dependent receptor [Rhodohalobacter sp. SW132]|uniref:TonB-dependent receptor n=1 Tax=Rhodohalobacter sp. SW132 TaxID=2293433 RepID=UPI000E23E9A0|nr:TonB-dependent receptor [Rhodohalobacter sp. SW132]REL25036.1 TonB-dependent receptor [Rhodohalobacter sp. SW132]
MQATKLLTVFVLLLCSAATQLSAQVATGTVYDSDSGEPIPGATVTQLHTQNGTVTNSEGEFRLELLSTAEQAIEVRFVGYQPSRLQIETPGQPLEIYLQQGAVWGDEIFVEGVRVSERAPFTQTTVERARLEQDNVGQDPIYTLERFTPSILTHSDSGTRFANYGYMRLRGMDQTRINMTLNGIPLNDMIDQGVFFSNFNDFGNSIQSVQVQRGVGTSTNGTASYAGSVNFESKNITMDDPSGEVKLTGGAFNSYRLSTEVNTGSINNFGLQTRFTQTESDGYRNHSGTESRSFFLSGGYFGSTNIFKVTAFTGYTFNELAYDPVPIQLIRENPRANTISVHDEDNFGQQFLQFQYGRSFSDRLSLASSLYYGGAGGDFPVGFPGDDGEFVQQVFSLFNDHYGLLSSLQYTDGDRFELSGGIHAYRFDRVNEETFNPESADLFYSDQSQKDELSAFAKASYRMGDVELYGDLQLRSVWLELNPDTQFLVNGGVAASTIDVPVRQWTFLNPKAGVTWFVTDRFDIYGSFGRSGREPTRQDILGATNINPGNLDVVSDRSSVRAEYVNNVEGGVRFRSASLSGKLNGFYMQFENEISPTGDFIPEGFIQLRENIDESYRAGIEAEWLWMPMNRLSLSGNATWMQTRISEFSPGGSGQVFTDRQSILSPEWLANGTINYMFYDFLNVSLTGRYIGEAYLELTNRDDLTLPSSFITNFGVDATISRNISASIKLHNVFDELYYTNGAPVDTNFDGTFDSPGYIVQPPRHLFAELTIRF